MAPLPSPNEQLVSLLEGSDRGSMREKLADAGVEVASRFGIYYKLSFAAFGYGCNIMQSVVFVLDGRYFFALMTLMFVAWTLYHQFNMVSLKDLRLMVSWTLATGTIPPELYIWFSVPSTIKDSFLNLLVPYCIIVGDQVSQPKALFSVICLMQAIHSMATEMQSTHMGGAWRQYCKTLVKSRKYGSVQLHLLQLITHCTVAAQVTLHAIFMRIYHPLLSVVLFIPVAAAEGWGVDINMNPCWSTFLTMLEPLNLITISSNSFLGLPYWSPFVDANLGNRSVVSAMLAQTFRLLTIFLLSAMDFPAFPTGPMGRGVLFTEFLEPALHFIHGESAPSGPDIYRAFLVGTLCFSLPVYLIMTWGYFICSAEWRHGHEDQNTMNDLQETHSTVQSLLFEPLERSRSSSLWRKTPTC